MTAPAWQLSFGANLIDPHRTRFRLWAPAQKSISLAVDDHEPLPMTASAGGWFEATVNCGPGARYRFLLQDGAAVPDPASRAQSGDVDGASIVVDPASYRWRNKHWRGRPWEETVLYEFHAGLVSGFTGAIGELPRLAGLGVTAIELMPIGEFPGQRNWGYDGVLLFAPESSYGSPDELKSLIDAAHDHGLMIFLDVVYNHFGPAGNYLARYAPEMFRSDVSTPWGVAIDFRRNEVRRFFTDNALYWLLEYRFDGLRLDAVHALTEPDWLDEMAAEVRQRISDRHVHLVLENEDNAAGHLARNFDAQWNDDAHHVLHVLLTGERQGYYQDYADRPAERLARCLKEGFIYQGEPSRYRGGRRRGTISADLPPTAFVLFLQNHDQIGNRAFGERLATLADPSALEAAIALQLLCPQIPLLFMGEETASASPFLFFTDHNEELAKAVREGRQREFASFAQLSDASLLSQIPDPNAAETFHRSKPNADGAHANRRQRLYQTLLALRRAEIVPRLAHARACDAQAVGPAAVMARWRMGDASMLTLASNLGREPITIAPLRDRVLFATSPDAQKAAGNGHLPPYSTIALLAPQ